MDRVWTRRLVLGAAAGLAATPAGAIVRRHDVPDERYRVPEAEWPTVADVGGVGGTVIAPRWILSAAHPYEDLEDDPTALRTARVNGEPIAYDKVIFHPRRIRAAVDSDFDLALLRLARPTAVEPTPLYRWSDEPGKPVLLVGRGQTGTGAAAERVRDRVLRRATNTVEAVFEHSLVTTLTAPPAGTELEGSTGPSDSGGPLFMERDGRMYLAGVNSFNAGGGTSPGGYETLHACARVSGHLEWIEGTMRADPASSIRDWSPMRPATRTSALPSTEPGRVSGRFLDALARPRSTAMATFYRDHGAVSQRPPEARAATAFEVFADGPYRLHGYRTLGDDRIAVFLTGRSGAGRALLFRLSSTAPGRLADFSASDWVPD